MPFKRPTLPTLIDRVAGDIEARLQGANARLRRNLLTVIGRAIAGTAHGLYGYLDYLARQLFPDTADTGHLERWALIWGVTRAPAVAATGEITLTGIDNATAPAGSILARGDGAEYTLDADATIANGTATAAVTAATPGAAANTDGGAHLHFVNPIAGIDSTATVAAAGLNGGADAETDDALRARLLSRIQKPPQGGNASDYRNWARAVAGVTRAWVYPLENGDGTVTVRIAADQGDNAPIPDAATVTAVQDYIDARRPVTAIVTVAAPGAATLDLSISLKPNTTAVQTAVRAELVDLLRRAAKPGGTILFSHLNEAVATAAGEGDHQITSPTADVAHTTGKIAVLGTLTWSTLS